MPCNGCGVCCEVIPLAKSKEELEARHKEKPYSEEDMYWLRNKIVETTIEEALLIRPELINSGKTHFFKCINYDPINKVCTDYENRPPVCRNYPWYSWDISPETASTLPETCGYRADVYLPVKLVRKELVS